MLLSHWQQPKVTEMQKEVMSDGTVHLMYTQVGNKERALAALKALIKATKHIKPDPLNGGAAAIRELRDGR